MRTLLYPHGGSGNHGCEAIVRATVQTLDSESVLLSEAMEEDIKYGLGQVCDIRRSRKELSRASLYYWKAFVRKNLLNDPYAYDEALFAPVLKQVGKVDVALSIGGDNYCYGIPQHIFLMNRLLHAHHIKTVLWGCSINPEVIQGALLEDLKSYAHIFARESITYDALKSKGIQSVTLVPDPAFVLKRKDLPLPANFIAGNTVGINVSPLVIGMENQNNITLTNYIQLMNYIVTDTDMNIALIPHVVWSHNDDRKPLQILYDKFKDTNRVCMLSDAPAEILKGYIGRCRFMIAARTHASIAAYSEKVPTLVVGYSVKARGIAKDLFGTDKDYVLPIQQIRSEQELTTSFRWLVAHESHVRACLEKMIPLFKEKVAQSKQLLTASTGKKAVNQA